MPKFKNGLAKVGPRYHYKFEFKGKAYHGSTGCETRAAAEQVLQQLRNNAALEAAGVRLAPRNVPTLAKVLEDWTRAQTGVLGERHVTNVQGAILLHLRKALPLPLNQIDNQVVEDARTDYLNCKGIGHRPGQEGEWELGHTLGGANKLVQHLSSVVGWAVRRGTLPAMPFKLPKLKPEPKVKPVLWPELTQSLLAEAARGRRYPGQAFPHSETAMRLQLQLGLREDEALGARWEWLDRRRQCYTVGENKSRTIREIHVPAALLDHLDRVLGPTTARPTGLIIPAEDGKPHGPGFTAKPVERCGLVAGIPGLHPHRLRASFATAHFEAGTDIGTIQKMLGHEDQETTWRYIVQRPKDQALAQERVALLQGFQAPEPGTIQASSQPSPEKLLTNKAISKVI